MAGCSGTIKSSSGNKIRTLLGLETDAPNQRLQVQPVLPKWLPDLTLKNLAVGDAKVTLRFWQDGEQTSWKVINLDGELHIDLKDDK
ncbi:hypothetical protein C7B65_23835 [Phormidesmis priestleyi ULC007]|uniref:Uncharacterized protein n=1 Tax=Phormidesmis priestleyi ULC007 TaxID=1920490 RepID=A0A2T1D590_9CYAN|nr:hypothetical protein [Phormidesmis priestleyi]PSB15695.1 hypothetical protein C7B65_23835 [Phormidesmis priestleyi ULC007]PZO45955.1 MAG: hypothetical protein DCF14_24155 [Phormidesmis priestleyi]